MADVIPGTVYVENLRPHELDIPLTDGTNLHCGPWSKNGTDHKSRSVARKLLPLYVRRLAAQKPPEIRIVEGGAA
jgi:hypothetical protein